MIDEGLWLVCYEDNTKGTGNVFLNLHSNTISTDLIEALSTELNLNARKDVFITNMVRLGDLKEEKDGRTT